MAKGNNPERWEKLLNVLDEKLQLGLLDRMRRVETYHFEENCLFLEPATADEASYLSRDPILQQLKLFAQDAIGITDVKITATRTTK